MEVICRGDERKKTPRGREGGIGRSLLERVKEVESIATLKNNLNAHLKSQAQYRNAGNLFFNQYVSACSGPYILLCAINVL